MQRGQAVGLLERRLVERHPSELAALLLAQRADAVIESRHQDMPRRVFEPHQDLCQGLRRIWCHSAEQSGMHVGAGGFDAELEVDQAAQRVGDRREALGHH